MLSGFEGALNRASGYRSKASYKKPPGQKPKGQMPPGKKLPRIIEKIISKYVVDANLFRLGSTNL